MTVCCRSLIVSRLGAPPSGVQNPPTLVPHAIAMTSAEPNTLLPMSSMPMKRSIARTTGIIAAATTVFGRNALRTVAMANHTDDLPPRARADADQRHQRDAAIQSPPRPDSGEDVRAEQQKDQLFGIRRQDSGDRKEIEDGEHDERKESGDRQIDRLENPPPRHPDEQAEAAAHRIVQHRSRQQQQREKRQRSTQQVERSPVALHVLISVFRRCAS